MKSLPFTAVVDFDVPLDADWTDPLWFLVPDPDGTIPLPTECGELLAVPFDFTGRTVEMVIVPTFGFSTEIVKLSSASGQITIDEQADGHCVMSMKQAAIAGFPVGSWKHITRAVTTADGSVVELMRGAMNFHPRASF